MIDGVRRPRIHAQTKPGVRSRGWRHLEYWMVAKITLLAGGDARGILRAQRFRHDPDDVII
jgi:hypothetical protein